MELLMPRGRVQVLRALLLQPGRELYLRELARRAGVSLSSAQAEVRRLTAAGLLVRATRGCQTFYRANTRCAIYPELRSLLLKTVGLGDVLRGALAGLRQVRLAFIYGSVAAGDERPGSDVDLLVVGTARPRAISDAIGAAEEQIGREVSTVVLTPREFRERVKRDDPFLRAVLEGPKIVVIGDEDEAARLAGGR